MMNWKKGLAVVLAGLSLAIPLSGCKKDTADSSSEASTSAAESSGTDAPEATTTKEETTVTEHVSPTETVSSTLGIEKNGINMTLDRDKTNTYKANLDQFIQDGDQVQSCNFIFYAADGSSNIGTYKGACGVSVKDGSSAATDKNWYQSDDFSQEANGSYIELNWTVPAEVQKDIDPSGQVLVGYWWGDVQQVRLDSIVCTFTRTATVPVDGTKSISPNTTLDYADESAKEAKISLGDLITEGDTLQTVTFDVSGGGSLGKFTGAFGVSVAEDSKAATDKGWYQSSNVVLFTDSNAVSLTWIVPDEVKADIQAGGEVMLGYWWSDQNPVTLTNVSVRYSNDGITGSTATTATPADSEKKEAVDNTVEAGDMTASEIVDNIRIGWNLGNTFDSYNTSSSDTETGWGNPKTTKAMIDTVKDAGFNAIRIPVTWGEHLSADYTIDANWMARIKEVVDYAYDQNMFVILNVHHDDALWLVPTNAKLEEDKTILSKIWTQIGTTFQDYDSHLIFEGMNEPRVIGSSTEWSGGTPEERQVINQLFVTFTDTVRGLGGNNAKRALIVTSHAQSIVKDAVQAIEIPNNDPNIIVSIHSYAPWDFAGTDSERSTWGTDADKQELDQNFQFLKETFVDKGIPVILDEFGAVNKNNEADRDAYYEYYVKSAKAHGGIKCFVWDNGTQKEFGLLNRSQNSWYFPSIVDAMMRGAA